MGIAIWRSVWVDYGPDAGTEPAQKFGPEICHLMKISSTDQVRISFKF